MENKFEIKTILMSGNRQVGCEILLNNQTSIISFEKCAEWYKSGDYVCDNAILVYDIYFRAKRGKLARREIKNRNEIPIWIATKNDINYLDTIETKRYVYDLLLKKMEIWENTSIFYKNKNHAIILKGVEKTGKTTVLKQLYNKLSGVLYLNGTEFCGRLDSLFYYSIDDSIRYIFIDDVCKLSTQNINTLISYVKCGSDDRFFILADNILDKLSSISASICSCIDIDMQPIMYIERLAWENGVSLHEALQYTTYEKFIEWVKTDELFATSTEHIRGIVEEILEYHNTWKFDDDFEAFMKKYKTDTKSSVLDMMLEYILLIKIKHYYYNIGKYGVNMIYTLSGVDFYKHIMVIGNTLEENIATDLEDTQTIVITTKDQPFKEVVFTGDNPEYDKLMRVFHIRNDIVVLLLEIAYVDAFYKIPDIFHGEKSLPIYELYEKYNEYFK